MCSFNIRNPGFADLNDMMYIRFEYMDKATATIIKGKSLEAPDAMYEEVSAGTTFTGVSGVHFWVLFEA